MTVGQLTSTEHCHVNRGRVLAPLLVKIAKVALEGHQLQDAIPRLPYVPARLLARLLNVTRGNRLDDRVMLVTGLLPVIQLGQFHPDIDLALFQKTVQLLRQHGIAAELRDRAVDLDAGLHFGEA
jgi:hypothetical protein